MAKALLGHVGSAADLRFAAELRRLQLRVRDLEEELARVRTANDLLSAAVPDALPDAVVVDRDHREYAGELREPALA